MIQLGEGGTGAVFPRLVAVRAFKREIEEVASIGIDRTRFRDFINHHFFSNDLGNNRCNFVTVVQNKCVSDSFAIQANVYIRKSLLHLLIEG